jgi:DNA/RNA-binding domain of Phe-tRNA-synthetase-like protein
VAAGAEALEGGAGWEPRPERGWVAPDVASEFPGLGISWVTLDAGPRPSPESVLRRLRGLSDRFRGSHAVHLRERPIPWAYRVFFRQVGLDPDTTRTPVERLALERLQDGAFKSRGLPRDAISIATVETSVALRAFDAEQVGKLCVREAAPGESLPERPGKLAQGTLVIADERGPVGMLFGEESDWDGIERVSRRLTIAAVHVNGVPEVAVDEALWICAGILRAS